MARENKRGTLSYLNYYNGKEEIVTDEFYQARFDRLNFDKIINDLFYDNGIKITKLINDKVRTEIIYKITSVEFENTIYITAFKIKNSGMRKGNTNLTIDRKRIQIYANYFGFTENNQKTRRENDIYFFLGIYPINSNGEYIFTLLENDGVSLAPKAAYSSLWIDYAVLKQTIFNGVYFAVNKVNFNKYVCFNDKYKKVVINSIFEDDYSTIINNANDLHFIDDQGSQSTLETSELIADNFISSRDAVVTIDGKAKIRKNSALREVVLVGANYTCELCGKSETFITNNNKMYFEAHHLIPCNLNNQLKFERKLDHLVNLYCLCPECHRKVHFIHSNRLTDVIRKLYKDKEKNLVKNYNISLNELVNIYKGIDRSNENEM